MSNKQPSSGDHKEAVANLKDRKDAEKQRKVINESYAVIRRKHINSSLRSLSELVEKKTCGTR